MDSSEMQNCIVSWVDSCGWGWMCFNFERFFFKFLVGFTLLPLCMCNVYDWVLSCWVWKEFMKSSRRRRQHQQLSQQWRRLNAFQSCQNPKASHRCRCYCEMMLKKHWDLPTKCHTNDYMTQTRIIFKWKIFVLPLQRTYWEKNCQKITAQWICW